MTDKEKILLIQEFEIPIYEGEPIQSQNDDRESILNIDKMISEYKVNLGGGRFITWT
jgi:hypothetical protein